VESLGNRSYSSSTTSEITWFHSCCPLSKSPQNDFRVLETMKDQIRKIRGTTKLPDRLGDQTWIVERHQRDSQAIEVEARQTVFKSSTQLKLCALDQKVSIGKTPVSILGVVVEVRGRGTRTSVKPSSRLRSPPPLGNTYVQPRGKPSMPSSFCIKTSIVA